MVKDAVDTLRAKGLDCDIVGGGGTGSYYFESASGVYNELQCGSYAFMDADYGRILDKDGKRIDQGEWENADVYPNQCDEPCKSRQSHR
jgi:3-hydroxy-D-aspartate aldolase